MKGPLTMVTILGAGILIGTMGMYFQPPSTEPVLPNDGRWLNTMVANAQFLKPEWAAVFSTMKERPDSGTLLADQETIDSLADTLLIEKQQEVEAKAKELTIFLSAIKIKQDSGAKCLNKQGIKAIIALTGLKSISSKCI